MRIFATSDLHTDFRENRLFLQQLSDADFRDDALIVAGDIAHRLALIQAALALLRRKFAQVFYVPGNHDLWVRSESETSVDKFHRIVDLCEDLGVSTRAAEADGHWVVPLFSWYSPEFDTVGGIDAAALESWGDFHFCAWPERAEPVSRFFAAMNQPHIRPYPKRVVSFSHFLPRPDLLPPASFLRFKGLPQVAGSAHIESQIRALHSAVHVFGHSHIRRDCVIDRVRYVQHGLGYPRERGGDGFSLKLIGGEE